MNGGTSIYESERVTFTPDEALPDRFVPQVVSVGSTIRDFEPEDMNRVMDYDNMDEEPPQDASIMIGEGGETDHAEFPKRHCCLRAGFVFFLDLDDVDDQSGPYVQYLAGPLGVIPLESCLVEFPPGGRRVFREHAHTEAKSGYELVILHNPSSGEEGTPRPPAFMVLESLGQREKWASAIRARAAVSSKPTILRAGYTPTRTHQNAATTKDALKQRLEENVAKAAAASATAPAPKDRRSAALLQSKNQTNAFGNAQTNQTRTQAKKREIKSIEKQVMAVSDDIELASAVVEFGVSNFNDNEWLDCFFQVHSDFDAPGKCQQMEQWQIEMKKSLKGAVLEQYEYFVQASGEMTTMGKEVSSLKSQVELQLELIKQMKEIDFAGALRGQDGQDEIMGEGRNDNNAHENNDEYSVDDSRKSSGKHAQDSPRAMDDMSEISELGSTPRGMGHGLRTPEEILLGGDFAEDPPPIEIPNWLDDCGEEILATLRECRYSDATELYAKAKTEVMDLLDRHEQPTAYRLERKDLNRVKAIQKSLAFVEKRICYRLEESLRRKNEALRQSSKRDRTAESSAAASSSSNGAATTVIISPCALNDDVLYLQLLVRIGRTQEAADAYTARRSLHLLEALNERPISGATGSVDLVIYAAQLSQSFFSCLATAVEGFMDLFNLPPAGSGGRENGELKSSAEDISLDASSLHSLSAKNIPAGAVASIVLWCDSELLKFAQAFGGTRILANLSLSPPTRDQQPQRGPRVVGGGGVTSEEEAYRERKNAIELASQCIDQAFMYASQNLDSVGLPLTPRLAEHIRVRLKGCEGEVSILLEDRWHFLTGDWRNSPHQNGNSSLPPNGL